MDSRKIIVACYLSASAIVWFLIRTFVQWLNAAFYQVRKLPGIEIGRESLPVVGALITFFVLIRHPKVNEVMDEVVVELKKVTWPSSTEVKRSTIVVMVCILLASSVLAFFDLVFGKVVGFLLS